MARGNKQEETKQAAYKAKALVCIKYDKTSYKPGDEFEVREEDAKELEYNGYAEVEEVLKLKEDEEREKEGE